MKNFLLLLALLSAISLSGQPDKIPAKKGDITITPIFHGSLVLQWKNRTLYIDPFGGADRFSTFPNANFVLITHVHGDHLNKQTLEELDLSETELFAPQSVVDELDGITFKKIWVLKNGEGKKRKSILVEAVPMYNLPETPDSRHPKGKGNGYVITLGKKRTYVSGDTEDIPEMRQLQAIDVAFVCMNLPYTMDINQAASAVLDFKPKLMYPYHFRGGGGKLSDVEKFKAIVNEGTEEVEVRIREWYAEKQ